MNKLNTKFPTLKDLVILFAKEGIIEIILFIDERKTVRYSNLVPLISSEPTLVRRLNELTSLGVIKKRVLNEKYRPVKYSLTKSGKQLVKIIKEFEGIMLGNG